MVSRRIKIKFAFKRSKTIKMLFYIHNNLKLSIDSVKNMMI